MKKNKKHTFAHQDPEKVNQSRKKTTEGPSTEEKTENYSTIKKDLKKTVATITFFIVLIIFAYYLEQNFSWIDLIKNKLS